MRSLALLLVLVGCGDDGSTSPPTPDAPSTVSLDTPANTWTWVEIPGTTCANGSPAGFGINRSTVGPDLFVYFQGGGACWDGQTCFVQQTSINIEVTYTAEQFADDIGNPTVNHADTVNPLSPATFVFVPYCTGDLHAGTQTQTYDVDGTPRTVAHVGAHNTQRFVDVLRAAFPEARTVWLAGSSAGGYGATFNHHRFVDAWANAEVHTLQDGSPFVQPQTTYSVWRTAWNIAFPPGCTACETQLPAVMDTLGAAYPGSRFGLLHYDDDAVIKAYFGFANTAGSMVPATNALLDEQYDLPNTKAFVLAGQGHTMIGQAGTLMAPGGLRLADWIAQWATGDAAWTTIRP